MLATASHWDGLSWVCASRPRVQVIQLHRAAELQTSPTATSGLAHVSCPSITPCGHVTRMLCWLQSSHKLVGSWLPPQRRECNKNSSSEGWSSTAILDTSQRSPRCNVPLTHKHGTTVKVLRVTDIVPLWKSTGHLTVLWACTHPLQRNTTARRSSGGRSISVA